MAEIISRFSQANLKTGGNESIPDKPRTGHLLSFSGGFDSLAALALMPPDTHLVSIDFGGHFARERDFFNDFSPLVISTNIRTTPLVNHSWAFMSIGALLASHHTSAKYHSFGSILASSINTPPPPGTFSLIRASKMIGADYVRGITEVGTVMIILRQYPHLLRKSLDSLASPEDEKAVRKRLLTLGVAQRLGLNIALSPKDITRKRPLKFGSTFANDFVTYYILKHLGELAAGRHFSGLSPDTQELVEGMTLRFMESYNPDFYEHFPAELLPSLYMRAATFGLHPYTSQDWTEFTEIKERLLSLHEKHRDD
ncbi:hypothetical protein ACQBAT_13935 [Ornithinimicrobium sp. Y1847]|uniref:hypothetical protein n=1 Tax=Ornithinimicrobium sp. Y1847 TaxID=3405419 RepID=UPI003B66FC8F